MMLFNTVCERPCIVSSTNEMLDMRIAGKKQFRFSSMVMKL